MSAKAAEDKAKKAAKKAKLKEEAEKLGISYEALKAQKKEKKKRKREAEALNADNAEHDGEKNRKQEEKRMRSWSGDFGADKKDSGKDGPATKRLRTRSMDKAEENAKVAQVEKSQSPEEWRKLHSITLRGYGAKANDTKFTDPFIEFEDAPFNPTIQKTLKAAGFDRPTLIQSQVCLSLLLSNYNVVQLPLHPLSFYLNSSSPLQIRRGPLLLKART